MGNTQGKLKLTPTSPSRMAILFFHAHFLASGTDPRYSESSSMREQGSPILTFTKGIYLPFTGHTPSSFPNIVQIFYSLTISIFFCVKKSRKPEDVKRCIKYFRYLHTQWHEVSMKFPVPIATALVEALAVQVELELGDADQDIEEMIDLCDELLNSDILKKFQTGPVAGLARAMYLNFDEPLEWKFRSEKVTDCLRRAIVRLPGLHEVSLVLARCLYNRFNVIPSDDDYEEGMANLDRILTIRGPRDEPSPYRKRALEWAAKFAEARFNVYGKPEYLEHAICRCRAFLGGISTEDPDHDFLIERLSYLEAVRTANIHDGLSVIIPPESAKLPSFRDLIASLPKTMDVEPDQNNLEHIQALRFCCDTQFTDEANIKDGIKYYKQLLVSYPEVKLLTAPRQLYPSSYIVHFKAHIKSSTSTRQFQLLGMKSTPPIHLTCLVAHLSGLLYCYQPDSDCYVRKKTCMKSCNSFLLCLTITSRAHMPSPLFHLPGRQLHAVSDTPLHLPHMTVPCPRCRPPSHLLRHLTHSIPGSSQCKVVCTRFRWTTHPITSTAVISSRPSRPSNEGEDYYGHKCAAFVPRSIKFVWPTQN